MSKSTLWSIVKYVLAIILLTVIFEKAQADKIVGYLKQIPPLSLLSVFLLISTAQVISGLRMRFFFRASGFHLSPRFAIILYYVGAFYNFLLPGGIGGDAYKVILARRRMNVTAKEGIRIMLADRASGLCIVMLVFFIALMMLDLSNIPYAYLLLLSASVVTLICYLLFCKWLLKQAPTTMLISLGYSLAAQLLWIGGILKIWQALGNGRDGVSYAVLYCASSITGLLPISVGGLGIKEMTYYYGAGMLQRYVHSGADGNLGVAISLCIFVLTLASSLPGFLWLNKVEKIHYA